MFKIMGTYDIGIEKLYVGQQNFQMNIVLVKVGNRIVNCPMFADEDNDIYFVYKGRRIYFSHLK